MRIKTVTIQAIKQRVLLFYVHIIDDVRDNIFIDDKELVIIVTVVFGFT